MYPQSRFHKFFRIYNTTGTVIGLIICLFYRFAQGYSTLKHHQWFGWAYILVVDVGRNSNKGISIPSAAHAHFYRPIPTCSYKKKSNSQTIVPRRNGWDSFLCFFLEQWPESRFLTPLAVRRPCPVSKRLPFCALFIFVPIKSAEIWIIVVINAALRRSSLAEVNNARRHPKVLRVVWIIAAGLSIVRYIEIESHTLQHWYRMSPRYTFTPINMQSILLIVSQLI